MFKENNNTKPSQIKNLTMHAPSPVLSKNPSSIKLQRLSIQNPNRSNTSAISVQKLPLGPRKPLTNITNIKNNIESQSSINSARQLSANGRCTNIKESTQFYQSHQIIPTRQIRSSSSFSSAPQSSQSQSTQYSSNTQKPFTHSQRGSKLLKCLQESIDDLNSCPKHPHQPTDMLCLYCCMFTCKDCTADQIHKNHEFLNAHEFMECPILPFIQSDKFLCETVSQSGKLAGKIKQKLDTQQKRVKECLDGMIKWMQNRADEILIQFGQSSEQQFKKISESIDSIENVSALFKNEWYDWIGQNDINSKQELEEICMDFIKNGQSPKEVLQKTCSSLRNLLKCIPEPDFNALRDLYVRVTDPLRFSYENLIVEKSRGDIMKPWKNILNIQLNSLNEYLQENNDFATNSQTHVELISYLKNTNSIIEINSQLNEIYLVNLPINNQNTKSEQLQENKRQLLFQCSQQSEPKSIINALVTKDEKQLIVNCKNQGVAVVQLNESNLSQTNCQVSWLQQSNSTALALCELSNQSLAVGYSDNSIQFYSLNNPGVPFHSINLVITPYAFHSTIDNSQTQSRELLAVAGIHAHDIQHPRPTLRYSYANNTIIQILDVSHIVQTYVIQSLSSSIISAGIASMQFMKIPKNQLIKTQKDTSKDKCYFKEGNQLENNKQSSSHSSSYEVILVVLTQDCRIVTWNYLNLSALPVAFNLNFLNDNCDSDQTKTRNVKSKKMEPASKFQVFDADTLLVYYEGSIFAVSLSDQKILGEIALIKQKSSKENKKTQLILSSNTFLFAKNENEMNSILIRNHTHLGVYVQDN